MLFLYTYKWRKPLVCPLGTVNHNVQKMSGVDLNQSHSSCSAPKYVQFLKSHIYFMPLCSRCQSIHSYGFITHSVCLRFWRCAHQLLLLQVFSTVTHNSFLCVGTVPEYVPIYHQRSVLLTSGKHRCSTLKD